MKKRIYLKPEKKKFCIHFKLKKGIILILFLLFSIFLLYFFGNKISKTLKEYSKIETEKFLTTIVNEMIKNEVLKNNSGENMIEVYKNEEGDILYADFNNEEVNAILSRSVSLVQNNLIDIENGKIDKMSLPDAIDSKYNKLEEGIIIEVPTGSLINNSLFSNFGPKIPIRIELLGAVQGNIKTDIKEYGINNSMVSINIVIDVTEQIVLPISSDKVNVKIEIPIATKLIQGKIPTYYQNGLNTNSSIFSLPTN